MTGRFHALCEQARSVLRRAVLVLLLAMAACSRHAGMVYVRGGDYLLGDQRRVHLPSFYIDRCPVTCAQYQRFLETSQATGFRADFHPNRSPQAPAVNVRYQAAEAYACWLGKRLPTSDEWEAAARGNDLRVYPWGDRWMDSAVDPTATAVAAVGQHPQGASRCGAEDMVGSVFQWTSTPFEIRTHVPLSNYYKGNLHVIRGGTFPFMHEWNQCAFWTCLREDAINPFLGFRCVSGRAAEEGPPRVLQIERQWHFGEIFPFDSEALRQVLNYELDPNRKLAPALAQHIHRMGRDSVVADVGAGVGYLSYLLAAAARQVYAVDIEQSVLDFVQGYCGARRIDNIRVLRSRPDYVPLPEGGMDEIYLLGTVHCLWDRDRAGFLRSCVSSLKPGGRLVVVDRESYAGVTQSLRMISDLGCALRENLAIEDGFFFQVYRK